jgi:hypothetical protein
MCTRSLPARVRFLSVALVMSLALAVSAAFAAKKGGGGNSGGGGSSGGGSNPAVTVNVYLDVVDEQNLNIYYDTSGSCSGSIYPIPEGAFFTGDTTTGPSNAYEFAPWTQVTGLTSSDYVNGQDCNVTSGVCLGANLNHNNTVLSLDTRGTLGPRTLKVDFGAPCLDCSLPGNSAIFGSTQISVPALISVFMDNPFTSMAVCTSVGCPEAQPAFIKLWFDDPLGDPQLTYRVDWPYVRVLRMSSNTWYVIGDGCDGTRVAWLYELHNQKHRQSVSLKGQYLIPFFLSGVQ